MTGKPQFKTQQFLEAIYNSGGIIITIAQRVGCSWYTAKNYIERRPKIAEAYRNECERVLDLAESTVLKAIRDGDVSTAKWYLTTKGKDRGYSEKHLLEHEGRMEVDQRGTLVTVTPEQALRLLQNPRAKQLAQELQTIALGQGSADGDR